MKSPSRSRIQQAQSRPPFPVASWVSDSCDHVVRINCSSNLGDRNPEPFRFSQQAFFGGAPLRSWMSGQAAHSTLPLCPCDSMSHLWSTSLQKFVPSVPEVGTMPRTMLFQYSSICAPPVLGFNCTWLWLRHGKQRFLDFSAGNWL